MQTELSPDEFAVLVRRAGLRLTPTQLAEMYDAWQHMAPLVERIRGHERGRAAEPAMIFQPGPLPEAVP